MLSPNFLPVEHFGLKWDRGMQLFEFEALREPEKTRFPLIGEFVRQHCEMIEIQTPQMLWKGRLWPDLYISNQLDAVPEGMDYNDFTATFIEPMCRKIGGISWTDVEKGKHRALWLPLYWPETIQSRQGIPTRFWYPRKGYAGAVAESIGTTQGPVLQKPSIADTAEISIGFLSAKPDKDFSVLFVLDESPIYRVTDMDNCAGLNPEFHRIVIEYRGNCGLIMEMGRLCLIREFDKLAYGKNIKLALPTRANSGHDFTNHMNNQIWRGLHATARPGKISRPATRGPVDRGHLSAV